MRLNKAQREAVISWVAEGLQSDEINKRAAKFKPRFQVSPRVVTHYRKSRQVDITELTHSAEFDALRMGLSLKHERVAKLHILANTIFEDLTTSKNIWDKDHKFNKQQVDSYRGLLDDIAQEIGDRGPGVQVNNTYNFNIDEWKKVRAQRLQEVADIPEPD